jgi:hypothetical protein
MIMLEREQCFAIPLVSSRHAQLQLLQKLFICLCWQSWLLFTIHKMNRNPRIKGSLKNKSFAAKPEYEIATSA